MFVPVLCGHRLPEVSRRKGFGEEARSVNFGGELLSEEVLVTAMPHFDMLQALNGALQSLPAR